jgi:hypothetical protein
VHLGDLLEWEDPDGFGGGRYGAGASDRQGFAWNTCRKSEAYVNGVPFRPV